MAHGAISVFTVSMATDATLTSAVDLGRAWKSVYLEIPSATSGTDVYPQVAVGSSSTFRRVYLPVNSGTAQANVLVVKSSVTNCMVQLPSGFQHVKLEQSTATTGTPSTYKIICSD